MADEPSSSEARDKDDPLKVLGGFLSEPTRRVRRTLLAVTTVALLVRMFGVRTTKLSLLGNELTIPDERWLPIGLFVVVLYFWVLFMVYAFGDSQRARASIWGIYRSGSSLTPADSLQHRESKSASVLVGLRVGVDVLLPFLYGGAGLLALLMHG
jgi:hypothetical protein